MWKDGGSIFLGIMYLVSLLFLSSQVFLLNYFAAISLKLISDGMIEKSTNKLAEGVWYLLTRFGLFLLIIPIFAYLYQYAVRKTTIIIRRRLFEHIIDLPMYEFEKNHTGDFLSRINFDVNTAEGVYSWQLMVLLMSIVSAIGCSVAIFLINKIIFFYVVLVTSVNILVNAIFMKRLREISNKIQEAFSKVTQKLSDIVGGAYIIRAFDIADMIFKKYVEINSLLYRLALRRVNYSSILASFNYTVGYFIFFGMLALGGYLMIRDKITFGNMVAAVQLMGPVVYFFGSLGNFLTNLQISLAGAERIFEILDKSKEENERKKYEKNIHIINKNNWVIRFENVSFSYDSTQEVLKGISFEVKEGEKIAIVGPSGGGKSTIFKLLLGFYPHYDGNIYVLGKEIRSYTLEELRNLISYMPQDVYLFNTSVYENIRYGNLRAKDGEITEALKRSNSYDFVIKLPDGLSTKVGERGVFLSGGQRQRLSIARAILKNSPILLLDEATSSLDSESENLVIQALNNLIKDKTALIIAHRLSTVKDVDRIIVIDGGKIVEEGNHSELLEKGGKYKELWDKGFQVNGREERE